MLINVYLFAALVFMKHLPFDVLEKTSFEKLLKKHANGPKYLFILDSPSAQVGVWNNILKLLKLFLFPFYQFKII